MIFKNRDEKDSYKEIIKTHKGIRVDMDTALDIEEMQDVSSEALGKQVSQNILLTGIINSFIYDLKDTAKVDEELAVNKLSGIVENEMIRRYYPESDLPYRFVWK